jgi:uncharacterized membrane protein YbhN (UPF0104 family)
VVERVLDVLTVVLMLVLLLPFVDAPGWAVGPAVVAGVVFLVLAVLLATLSLARRWALGVVDWGTHLLSSRHQRSLHQAAESVMDGFAVLSNPAVLAQSVGWSFASWFASALMMFFVQQAFDLGVGFEAAPFVLATTALVMLVPASPGYVGTFELATIKGMENVFDVGSSAAASYALVQHGFLYLSPIIIAAVYLWREREAWRQVRLWARQAAPAEEATPGSST